MEIYIVLCEEKHIDPFVRIYNDKAKAVEYAESLIERMYRWPESAEDELNDDMRKDGFVYWVRVGEDGGHITVRKGLLNNPDNSVR